jgi:hypothetical protein
MRTGGKHGAFLRVVTGRWTASGARAPARPVSPTGAGSGAQRLYSFGGSYKYVLAGLGVTLLDIFGILTSS